MRIKRDKTLHTQHEMKLQQQNLCSLKHKANAIKTKYEQHKGIKCRKKIGMYEIKLLI
jgi:superfamily II RNA helicase